MREILFRGKRVDNGEWVEGYYVHQYGAYMIYLPGGTNNDGFDIIHIYPDTVGQFTGLHDKNGKRIFEGDILAVRDAEIESQMLFTVSFGVCGGVKNVEYAVGYMGFYLEPFDERTEEFIGYGIRDDIVYWLADDAEVIGTIHDNPELLGGACDG